MQEVNPDSSLSHLSVSLLPPQHPSYITFMYGSKVGQPVLRSLTGKEHPHSSSASNSLFLDPVIPKQWHAFLWH